MPRSINGTGTMWYGHALRAADGSYVVTEWITVFGLPLVPLGSMRVVPDAMKEHWLKYSKNPNVNYYKTLPVPLHWPHVIKGYAVVAAIFGAFYLMDYFHI